MKLLRHSVAAWTLDWCPIPSGMRRKLDALLGTVLTTHLLHHHFIANRVACDPAFPMDDRSPDVLIGREQSSAAA